MARLLAFVGVATLAGYLFTPEPNLPGSIVYDLRFVALTVLTGVLTLPLLTAGTRWSKVVLAVFGVLVIATQFAKGIWWGSPSLVAYHSLRREPAGRGIVLVAGGVLMQARRSDRRGYPSPRP